MRVVDLKIEDIAFGGKGVAREKGKAVFVSYTMEDELVSAEIVREKKQFAEAELLEVKESSPDEVNRAIAELRKQRHVRNGHYTLRTASEPRVFSQINCDVGQALRELIVNLVPPNQHLLIDAYCGAGFFAKALLDKFERIIGIDWDKFAIAAARKNAAANES